MILGLEIALTVMGIMFLARGKGLGNDAVSHPHYRILGGFMVTVLPVAVVLVFGFGVVWAVMHPDQSVEELDKSVRLPAAGIEVVVAISYGLIAYFWEKLIKGRALARQSR